MEKFTVLYVYSSYDSVMPVSMILRASGLEVVSTTYESNILDAISDLPEIAIVVLDHMDSIEYLEYCKQLKNDSRTRNAPIIVFVVNEIISREQVIAAGADLYIIPPIDPVWFKETIAGYLKK